MTRLFRRLRINDRGAAVIEFAIIAPVLLLILFGILELGYRFYLQAVLQGAVQKAARDSTIEGGGANIDTIDSKVKDLLRTVAANATFKSERYAFYDFNEIAPPEPFIDANANGQWDSDECFEDTNGSGFWEGKPGQGGADDIVQYTMTMTYPEILPMSSFLHWPALNKLSATTTLRNQPFGTQARATGTICP